MGTVGRRHCESYTRYHDMNCVTIMMHGDSVGNTVCEGFMTARYFVYIVVFFCELCILCFEYVDMV